MSREAARAGLTKVVVDLAKTFPGGVSVELPNQLQLDYATQTKPFLKVDIRFIDGWQASIGQDRHHRVVGSLVLEAWVNQGMGMKPANDILEHFYPNIHMRDTIPGVRTFGAKFASRPGPSGWRIEAAIVPFWFDDIKPPT